MAYDEQLADEIRTRIGSRTDLTEKEMFGGIAFMIGGNMAVGVSGSELMVRVGKEAHDEAEARTGARTFDLSARPMRGWISVAPEGLATEADVHRWIDQGVAYAASLPRK
jgi:TfoX/Sxy family transcriptional regulator of competence genes